MEIAGSFRPRLAKYAALYVVWMLVFFTLTGGFFDPNWLRSWIQWDAYWYIQIAEHWYSPYIQQGFKVFAFPPGYSLLIEAVAWLSPLDFNTTAIVINIVTYFVALVLAVELLSTLLGLTSQVLFFIVTLTAPTSYVIFSVYTDALFMCVLWGILWLAILHPENKKSQLTQIVLLFCLPWIRITGYALLAWLPLGRLIASVALVAAAGWLYLNYYITGNMLFFIEAQKMFFSGGTMIDGLRYTLNAFIHLPQHSARSEWIDYLQMAFLPVVYLVFLIAAAAWFLYKKQTLLAVSMLSLLAISHYAPFWRSVVRYDMVLLPCLFAPLFFIAAKRKGGVSSIGVLLGALAMGQFILQIAFAVQFRGGGWGF